MKPDRAFVVIQSAGALAAVAAVSVLVAGGMPDSTAMVRAIPSALAFGTALLVLGFYNVWLPRGDAVDTTVPIAFAAGLLLHPLIAAGVVLLARCATVALKPRGHTLWTAFEQIGRRVILISVVYAALGQGLVHKLQSGASLGTLLAPLTVAAAVFIALDAFIEQAHASVRFRAPLRALVFGALRLQGWMFAAEISAGVLAVILFPTLPYLGLPLTVVLLLIMRQSFAVLLEVRASYTSTVEVLARSLEAYDASRRGHAERVARMCGEAGRAIGIQSKRLESLTYAALFHDVGRIGSDDPSEAAARASADVLASVGFLAGALPILRILDNAGEDDTSLDEDALIGAYLVARFSILDAQISSSMSESDAVARAVGSRLYSSTREAVDRVIARVERDARAGVLPAGALADVIA